MANDDKHGEGVARMLLTMITLNDQYHTAKETLFWLSASAYLTFSIVMINWLVTTESPWRRNQPALFAFVLLVAGFAHIFMILQNWHKARSAWRNGKFTELIALLDDEQNRTYSTLATYAKARPEGGRGRLFFTYGSPGFWVLFVTAAFFLAQVGLIFAVGDGGVRMMHVSARVVWIVGIALLVGGVGIGILSAFLLGFIRWRQKARDDLLEKLIDKLAK
jgi:hypothetical protein